MRIGIDARLYSETGIGRYISNLINALGEVDSENKYIIYLTSANFNRFELPNIRWEKKRLDIPWHTFREQVRVPSVLGKDLLDVVHFPYFNVPIFYSENYVLTIHDLIIDHYDTGKATTKSVIFYKIKRLGYKMITNIALQRAKAVLAISESTKKEIINHYHVKSEKITVTYDALDEKFKLFTGKIKRKIYYSFPYVLYVGNAYPHKNLERLVETFADQSLNKQVKLVLVGDDDFFFGRLKQKVNKRRLENTILFFGKANNENLFNLYTFAKCLVTPSLMEGFGLPNMEAVYCGCLPVVSDIPAFREVWGDRLIYFNPYRSGEISKAIMKLLSLSKKEYQIKVNKAKQRIVDFSWEKTAKLTLKTYENSLSL